MRFATPPNAVRFAYARPAMKPDQSIILEPIPNAGLLLLLEKWGGHLQEHFLRTIVLTTPPTWGRTICSSPLSVAMARRLLARHPVWELSQPFPIRTE